MKNEESKDKRTRKDNYGHHGVPDEMRSPKSFPIELRDACLAAYLALTSITNFAHHHRMTCYLA